jgi:hypothetical protein
MSRRALLSKLVRALPVQGAAWCASTLAALAAEAPGAAGPARNPAAPAHLPPFITAPGQTDVLMVVMVIILVAATVAVGILFLRLHTLPERLAHKSQKLQFEIVAVLGLLALFTHIHLFWVAGLLLALIELPDFSTPLGRMAGSLEKIARGRRREPEVAAEPEAAARPETEIPATGEQPAAKIVRPVRSATPH